VLPGNLVVLVFCAPPCLSHCPVPRCTVDSRAAVPPVVNQEGRRQAQQRFRRQERHLLGAGRRCKEPELLTCRARRQIQVIRPALLAAIRIGPLAAAKKIRESSQSVTGFASRCTATLPLPNRRSASCLI
jgi:hypothetical protein